MKPGAAGLAASFLACVALLPGGCTCPYPRHGLAAAPLLPAFQGQCEHVVPLLHTGFQGGWVGACKWAGPGSCVGRERLP